METKIERFDLQGKPMDWFLYDRDHLHGEVKYT